MVASVLLTLILFRRNMEVYQWLPASARRRAVGTPVVGFGAAAAVGVIGQRGGGWGRFGGSSIRGAEAEWGSRRQELGRRGLSCRLVV